MKDDSRNDLRSLLEEADPLTRESGLSGSDVERMRHRVVSATHEHASVHVSWPHALAAVAVLVLMVVAGARGVRDFSQRPPARVAVAVLTPVETAERRQLQFATPGGTRIIWTLDPQFKLEGVVP